MKISKWGVLAFLMVAICSVVSFISCSNDDDDVDSPMSSVVGTWTYVVKDSWSDITTTLTFKKDGNGTFNQKGDYGSGEYNDNYTFTYHMNSENEGMITFSDRVDFDGYSDYIKVGYFVVEASKLYIYESDNYSSKNLVVTLKKN